MKQVVANKPASQIYFEDISINKFYGALMVSGNKAIIKADNYATKEERTNFKLLSGHKFTVGNNYPLHCHNDITLTEYIKFLLSKGIVVYEFDKLSKLGEWLES
jgi:hypothetical protein